MRNPRSGVSDVHGKESTQSSGDAGVVFAASSAPACAPLCSDATEEPLPGTAKTGGLILALEHSRGWGKDILDGEALGKELTGQIKTWLKAHQAQLQFIRRPGRIGQVVQEQVVLYIADATAEPPTLERMELAGPEELTQVDLTTPGHTPGAQRVDHPLLLVCTHGKRDRCCAVKGRPLARGLHKAHPEVVWESSHTKGHRFAPAMILLPWNYSFGALDLCDADEMLAEVEAGHLPLKGNRGRGTLEVRAQVAELAVASALAEAGETVGLGELTVSEHIGGTPRVQSSEVPEELRRRAGELMAQRLEMKITGKREELKTLKQQGHFQPIADFEQALKASVGSVSPRASTHTLRVQQGGQQLGWQEGRREDRQDDREWIVTVESRRAYPVVASCGDRPKEGRSWVATGVEELPAHDLSG